MGIKSQPGFIYLWKDLKRNKYYLGAHMGTLNDGYTGSNKRFKSAYKSRPETFKRKIIESYENITWKELQKREEHWLSMINDSELHGVKYYNEKKVSCGGDIVSFLPNDAKEKHQKLSRAASLKYWNNISSEERQKRKQTAFGGNNFDRSYMIERNKTLCSKTARINFPNGVSKIVKNVADFAREHSLNYGNLKTVLRNGKGTCKGFSGEYL